LPNIEEINSSLRGLPPEAPTASPPPARGGFRAGFGGVLLLGAALALLYAFAPRLTGAVPASRVVIDPYVAAVDEGRLWLDLRLQGLLRAVDAPGEAAPADPAGGGSDAPAAPADPSTPSRLEAPPPDAPPMALPEGAVPPGPAEAPAPQALPVPATEPAREPVPEPGGP
jgi:hypothetical protein